tara:strand:+ start:1191 stop:1889 length:699 start_codon:yes stop_codon:yes gene_type:complete
MALINYKYTYLAGTFINLDVTLDSTHSASVLQHITGAYNPEVLKLQGIPISSQDLEFSHSTIWIQTRSAPNTIEYMAIFGAHIMTKSIPRNATKRTQRETAITNFGSLLDTDESSIFLRGAPGPKSYNYKYTFYCNQDTDACFIIYTHRQRTTTFLTQACAFIKRRGRINVYESVYSSTFINPMSDPIKIGIYSDIGEGGSLIVEDNNKNSMLSALSANDITAVTQTDLFPI